MTAAQNTYIDTLRRFKQEYGAEYGITQIGFFGSVARGDQTEESDVDVIVESPTASIYTLIGIKQELEKMFNKEVDVVGKTEFTPQSFLARVEKEVIYV
jgi:predicted nucleotidyltransferase